MLTGGASRRLGRDKATAHVGGRLLVQRLLADVPDHVSVVLVGEPVEGLRPEVRVTREDPAGSGPLAGIGAGMAQIDTPLVGVIAADMPFALPVVGGALAWESTTDFVGENVRAQIATVRWPEGTVVAP